MQDRQYSTQIIRKIHAAMVKASTTPMNASSGSRIALSLDPATASASGKRQDFEPERRGDFEAQRNGFEGHGESLCQMEVG